MERLSTYGVPRGGFDNTLQQPFALQDVFQHFRKLGLSFRIVDNLVEKNISQILSAATKLTSLCVTVDWNANKKTYRLGGPTTFQEIFGECEFPQLRSLKLEGFDSTEAELVGFFRSSSHLQHLILMRHRLRAKGKWESWANEIKVALSSLKKIVVHILESSVDDHSLDTHTHRCSHTDVQGFFFHGKVNPFICARAQEENVSVTFRY